MQAQWIRHPSRLGSCCCYRCCCRVTHHVCSCSKLTTEALRSLQAPAQAAFPRQLCQQLLVLLVQGTPQQAHLACRLLSALAWGLHLQLHAQDCASLLSALWWQVCSCALCALALYAQVYVCLIQAL